MSNDIDSIMERLGAVFAKRAETDTVKDPETGMFPDSYYQRRFKGDKTKIETQRKSDALSNPKLETMRRDIGNFDSNPQGYSPQFDQKFNETYGGFKNMPLVGGHIRDSIANLGQGKSEYEAAGPKLTGMQTALADEEARVNKSLSAPPAAPGTIPGAPASVNTTVPVPPATPAPVKTPAAIPTPATSEEPETAAPVKTTTPAATKTVAPAAAPIKKPAGKMFGVDADVYMAEMKRNGGKTLSQEQVGKLGGKPWTPANTAAKAPPAPTAAPMATPGTAANPPAKSPLATNPPRQPGQLLNTNNTVTAKNLSAQVAAKPIPQINSSGSMNEQSTVKTMSHNILGDSNMNELYKRGFIDKCAELGVDPDRLIKLALNVKTVTKLMPKLMGRAKARAARVSKGMQKVERRAFGAKVEPDDSLFQAAGVGKGRAGKMPGAPRAATLEDYERVVGKGQTLGRNLERYGMKLDAKTRLPGADLLAAGGKLKSTGGFSGGAVSPMHTRATGPAATGSAADASTADASSVLAGIPEVPAQGVLGRYWELLTGGKAGLVDDAANAERLKTWIARGGTGAGVAGGIMGGRALAGIGTQPSQQYD